MKFLTITAIIAMLAATPALAENPYAKPDGTWITLSGTVESVTPNTFEMNYGDGVITVEMDDGDRDADAYKLLAGDEVTVSGMIDDDFFETTTIEASSVYVKKLNTTFYASAMDEEDFYSTPVYMVIPGITVATGTVTEVGDEEFVLDTGARRLTVDVDDMDYNPLDDEGYVKIHKGDRVSVSGDIDYELFEGRVLDAGSIIVLHKAETNTSMRSQ